MATFMTNANSVKAMLAQVARNAIVIWNTQKVKTGASARSLR
jgi:hypothetical protein